MKIIVFLLTLNFSLFTFADASNAPDKDEFVPFNPCKSLFSDSEENKLDDVNSFEDLKKGPKTTCEVSTFLFMLNRLGINVTQEFLNDSLELSVSTGIIVNLHEVIKLDGDIGLKAEFYYTDTNSFIVGAYHTFGSSMTVNEDKFINTKEFGFGWKESRVSNTSHALTARSYDMDPLQNDGDDQKFIIYYHYRQDFEFSKKFSFFN